MKHPILACLAFALLPTAARADAYVFGRIEIADFTIEAIEGDIRSIFAVENEEQNSFARIHLEGGGFVPDPDGPFARSDDFADFGERADPVQATIGPGPFPAENSFAPASQLGEGARGDALATAGLPNLALVGEVRATSGGGASVEVGVARSFGILAADDTIVRMSFNGRSAYRAAISGFDTVEAIGFGNDPPDVITGLIQYLFTDFTVVDRLPFSIAEGAPCDLALTTAINPVLASGDTFETGCAGGTPFSRDFALVDGVANNFYLGVSLELLALDEEPFTPVPTPAPAGFALGALGLLAVGQRRR